MEVILTPRFRKKRSIRPAAGRTQFARFRFGGVRDIKLEKFRKSNDADTRTLGI